MPKIYLAFLDDGHGMETAGKRTPIFPTGSKYAGTFMHEDEFNRAVVKLLQSELLRCGVQIVLTAPTDVDTPLTNRTNYANKVYADYVAKLGKANVVPVFYSVHANAFTGVWGKPNGLSCHIYATGGESEKIAKLAHAFLMDDKTMNDRGVLVNNYHVLRETNMPSVLFELGFMDNLHDAHLLKSDEYRKKCAVDIARATCQYYGIPYKPYVAAPVLTPEELHEKELKAAILFLSQRAGIEYAHWLKKAHEDTDKDGSIADEFLDDCFIKIWKAWPK